MCLRDKSNWKLKIENWKLPPDDNFIRTQKARKDAESELLRSRWPPDGHILFAHEKHKKHVVNLQFTIYYLLFMYYWAIWQFTSGTNRIEN